MGQRKKEVFAPKFANFHVFIGLKRSDVKIKPGTRLEIDMFWYVMERLKFIIVLNKLEQYKFRQKLFYKNVNPT